MASLAFTAVASAASSPYSTDFDLFKSGTVNGQDGWTGSTAYDNEILTNSADAPVSFGSQSLRLSNVTADGGFAGQTHSPLLDQGATEAGALRKFSSTFEFIPTTREYQPGLAMIISPDSGEGSRMSAVKLEDRQDGVHVLFYDVNASVEDKDTEALGLNTYFRGRDVATLSRKTAHTIRFDLQMKPGRTNDQATLYVDGKQKANGKTWENYYRLDSEQNGNGNIVPPVNSLIFMARGEPVSNLTGGGFLFDNVELKTSG
jgi:hypothetical protein